MGKEIWRRAQSQSSSVKKGVCAAEPWEGREEEANPAQMRKGCRQGLGISWLRRVHRELEADLSLSDYWSQERGGGRGGWRQVEAGLAGGMEELEGKRGAGEGGHRGEGGTRERGEKRGVLSPGGVWWGQEDRLGVPWGG